MKATSKNPDQRSATERPLVSLRDLEHRLGESREVLRALESNWREEYKPFQQERKIKAFQRKAVPPKVRDIDNPSKQLKQIQKKILDRILVNVPLPSFLHGSVQGKSVALHAAEHFSGRSKTDRVVKLDIKKYFPSVTSKHVYAVWRSIVGSTDLASLLTGLTTYQWRLPQGAPTSPALANLYLASIYEPVLKACEEHDLVATAWVDDLTFSGAKPHEVMELVRQTLADNGFKLSTKKRIILTGRHSKVVTGVRRGAHGLRAEKNKVNDIRAAIHKLKLGIVPKAEVETYLRSTVGRIRYIEHLRAADAVSLRRALARVMETLPVS